MNNITLEIPKKLIPIAAEEKRFKIVIGGRGSGKSQTIAALVASKVDMNGIKVLAAREHMNSISDSVHSVIASNINKYSMPGFDIQEKTIKHRNGGGVIYRGLARNPDGLKSLDEVSLAWVEEAQNISQKSIETLTPSIRAKGSEIWMTGNPRSSKDPFSQRFIKPYEKELKRNGYYEDDLHLIILINYMDNPWFPDELEKERQFDYVNKPRAKYNHIWLGNYDDSVEDSIIKPEWFDACIDAHKVIGFKPLGAEVVAHDPSDTGSDSKGLCYRHGSVILDVREKETGDVNEGADWAIDYAYKIKPDAFVWDGDGMGVALRRQFNDAFYQKNTVLEMYKGSNSPDRPDEKYESLDNSGDRTNEETFRNKRAQYYWLLRDRIYATYKAVKEGVFTDPDKLISFSSEIKEIDLLRSEICRIPLKYNSNGFIQIMTKPEMKKLGIESPNMSDSVAMSFAYTPVIGGASRFIE